MLKNNLIVVIMLFNISHLLSMDLPLEIKAKLRSQILKNQTEIATQYQSIYDTVLNLSMHIVNSGKPIRLVELAVIIEIQRELNAQRKVL